MLTKKQKRLLKGKPFEVEFMTLDGSDTIAVVTLEEAQIRSVPSRVLMHARAF